MQILTQKYIYNIIGDSPYTVGLPSKSLEKRGFLTRLTRASYGLTCPQYCHVQMVWACVNLLLLFR